MKKLLAVLPIMIVISGVVYYVYENKKLKRVF